ncbi:recombinase family protein, partial [Shigella sonnei]|nr:recombinase family protein [Shigella sonnei]EFW7608173.1 recombinase family protein [Shigella sonnei]EFX0215713.1 recombinase family protein [Shigella sonnei]EFX6112600.1 recombinase family protein [Shigella sonnei]EGD8138111.1 recombinase family protein [Shigella sonnei]
MRLTFETSKGNIMAILGYCRVST